MMPSLTVHLCMASITCGKSLIEPGHPAVLIPCSWSGTEWVLVSFFLIQAFTPESDQIDSNV